MKNYEIDAETVQALANYIAQTPSPNLPVQVAVALLNKLQKLKEIDEYGTYSKVD